MCGITGFWSREQAANASDIAQRMARRIETRGPDDAGTWEDESAGLALGHRRLSILDLSPSGYQPMISPCGRYALVFNGEIYNHFDLRSKLKVEGGHFNWCGHSDTETLLAALRHWGVAEALSQLNGMFAFALWDREERTLFLARDRMGEKPLYYGHSRGVFLFGSELKTLTEHPQWQGEISRDALTLFLRHNYVPAPWSIYQGIYKLPPAHYVAIKETGAVVSSPHCYWDLGQIAEQGQAHPSNATPESLTNELDSLLQDSVARRLAADVPVGAFLSGGYDSTLVAALMQAHSSSPVKTFTIGFHEETHNEAGHAKAVARHLGMDHTELYVTPQETMAVIPKLPTIWDEPFADSSQIPTYLLSELARQHVTVTLSGDGGDELFYGYGRYERADWIWSRLKYLPRRLRQTLGAILIQTPSHRVDQLIALLPPGMRASHLGDRLPKLAQLLGHGSGEALYRSLISSWEEPAAVVYHGVEPDTLFSRPENLPKLPSLNERMMYLDTTTYLPDDILTKVDRASMAMGLEARVSLLDHRLVEFAWRLPMSCKYRNGQGKWLLRQVLYRYVPQELMDRPKMGFGVPIEYWLRGPLREWAESLLSEKRLREEGFFDPQPIRKMWEEHISGKRRWHYCLWNILMFQAWLEAQNN